MSAVLDLLKLTHGSMTTDEFDAVCRVWMQTARHPRFGRSVLAAGVPTDDRADPTAGEQRLCLLDFLRRRRRLHAHVGHRCTRAGTAPRCSAATARRSFVLASPDRNSSRASTSQLVDDAAQKPISIHQHLGQRPILAAGNTNGDLPMLQWTEGSPHRTLQLVVHHTDGEREYAYDADPLLGAGTDQILAAAADGNWSVIDIARDWATVYPDTR